jgi:hypothetical protein
LRRTGTRSRGQETGNKGQGTRNRGQETGNKKQGNKKQVLKPTRKLQTTNPKPTMGIWKQMAEYLYIKKRDPNEERTQWQKYMHRMNRISLIMFLVAVVIIIFKLVVAPLFGK